MIKYITKLLEGSAPRAKNEIAAEKWVLLNLGIEPDLDREFTIENTSEGHTETVKLVGILSDMSASKKYGTLELYITISELAGKDGILIQEKMNELREKFGIRKKQLKKNPAREDFQELYQMDVQVMIFTTKRMRAAKNTTDIALQAMTARIRFTNLYYTVIIQMP